MNIKIASAPVSWGVWFPDDPRQTLWRRFLDEIASAGYEWTELGPYGYLPTDPVILRAELDRRGLKLTGTFCMPHLEDKDVWPKMEKELRGRGELLQSFSAQFLVLIDDTYSNPFTGELMRPRELDGDGWRRLIENTHKAADFCRQFGLQLVFHPHADTHVEYPDQIERFLAETDPDRVGLCLDTGHQAYRGADPVELLKKHHPRIRYLHLKNIDAKKREQVEREKVPFAKAVAEDMFVEPSTGAVNFIQFRDVLRAVKYDGFAVVEQDIYPCPFDKPLPIARRTRAYLQEIGIG